jgi:prevent-host-death family protein
MDKTYNSRDARTNWRDVLDLVQGGGSVTVTRSGKAVARVVQVPEVGPVAVEGTAEMIERGEHLLQTK